MIREMFALKNCSKRADNRETMRGRNSKGVMVFGVWAYMLADAHSYVLAAASKAWRGIGKLPTGNVIKSLGESSLARCGSHRGNRNCEIQTRVARKILR